MVWRAGDRALRQQLREPTELTRTTSGNYALSLLDYRVPLTGGPNANDQNYVVRSAAAFSQLLNSIGAPMQNRPSVDFTSRIILAIYDGEACEVNQPIVLEDLGNSLSLTEGYMGPGQPPSAACVTNQAVGYIFGSTSPPNLPITDIQDYP